MNFFTRLFKMPTSAMLYHLFQTHLSLGDFQLLLSWWGLLWTILVHLGWDWIISNSGVICVYIWRGDVSCHGCLRNLPTFLVLLGVSTSPGPHSPRNSCMCGHKCCVHVYSCVWAHTDPVYLSCPCFILAIKEYSAPTLWFGDTALACNALKDSELPLLNGV